MNDTAIGRIMTEGNAAHPSWAGYYKSPEPDLYPAERHCAANGISRPMLYRLIKAGDIRTTKIRGRTYITRREWQRFLKSLSAPPPVDPLDLNTVPDFKI